MSSRAAVVVGLLQRPQFHQARAVLEVHVERGESERGRLREGQVARGMLTRLGPAPPVPARRAARGRLRSAMPAHDGVPVDGVAG